jgi:hypothetical protein
MDNRKIAITMIYMNLSHITVNNIQLLYFGEVNVWIVLLLKKKKKKKKYKGSNTSKRARRKNLRHPRERFLVSNEAPPSWRSIEILPS